MRARYNLLIFMIIAAAIFYGWPTLAQNSCRSEQGGYCLKLAAAAQAQVPGLKFLQDEKASPQDILPQLYVFGLSLIGVSALIMLIYGGILYMTAAGSQDQTKRARSAMGQALGGLVLALLSYLILNTLNPDLVKTWGPNLTLIKKEEKVKLFEDELRNALKPPEFKGTDEQWRQVQDGAIFPVYNQSPGCTTSGNPSGGSMAAQRTLLCSAAREKLKTDPNIKSFEVKPEGLSTTVIPIETLKKGCAEICIPLP